MKKLRLPMFTSFSLVGLAVWVICLAPSTAQAQEEGLLGHYFEERDPQSMPMVRTDPTVDFRWGGDGPYPEMTDNFLVRWVGLLSPLYAEEYVFSSRSDDGLRMWIDGHLVVDHWGGNRPTVAAGRYTLNPSRSYPVLIEYFEGGGNAAVQWFWESRSQALEIVPQGLLTATDPFRAGTPIVQLHSKDAWATEGGRDKAWITVYRFGRFEDTINVNLSYAQSGGPHSTGKPLVFTLEAGHSANHFEVAALNDDALSGDGELVITLEEGEGYTVGDQRSLTVQLLDDEAPTSAPGFGVGGEVRAAGAAVDAAFVVGVFLDESRSSPLDSSTVIGPGPFAVDGLPAGEYVVAAWRDADENGRHDAGEPWGDLGDGVEFAAVTLPPDAISLSFVFETRPVEAPDGTAGGRAIDSPPDEGCGIGPGGHGPVGFSALCLGLWLLRTRRRR